MDEAEVDLVLDQAVTKTILSLGILKASKKALKELTLPDLIGRIGEMLSFYASRLENQRVAGINPGMNTNLRDTILLGDTAKVIKVRPSVKYLYRAVTLPSNGVFDEKTPVASAIAPREPVGVVRDQLLGFSLFDFKTKLHDHLQIWQNRSNKKSEFLSCTSDIQRALFLTAQKGQTSLESGLMILKPNIQEGGEGDIVLRVKDLLECLDLLLPELKLLAEDRQMALNCDEHVWLTFIPRKSIVNVVSWTSLYGIPSGLITFEFSNAFNVKLFAKNLRKLHVTRERFQAAAEKFVKVLGGNDSRLRRDLLHEILHELDVGQWGYWITDRDNALRSHAVTGIKREMESDGE